MRFPRFVPFLVCLTLNTFSLFAQSPNGNINGLVSDPSSAAVVGAEIVAVNDVTGVQYTTKTNNEGIYVLPNLPPGPYRVQVSKIGFKTLIKPDITLNVQDSLSINFTLLVGAFHEIVTVQGGARLVNTESAAVSTVVDEKYVQNMPLNGRSFQDLILLTAGTVSQTPQASGSVPFGVGAGQTGEFSVNGQRTESNYYTVDGVSANVGAATGNLMTQTAGASGSLPGATTFGTTQALVSVDALQEFRVQSSTYSAEYGRNPGGQFAFETKSGTNQWRGTAYDYLRNGVVDAQDWFNDYFGTPAPALRQNDFGGTLGGPVRIPGVYNGRDKTFFFISYEGLRLVSPQPASITYVPDNALRASVPADLQPVLNAFPVPNGADDTANGFAQYIASWSNPSSLDSTGLRFDHVVNGKLSLFFRFSDTGANSANRGTGTSTPAVHSVSASTLRTFTAGAISLFSRRFSNDFRLNYSSNRTTLNQAIEAFGGNTPVSIQQLLGLDAHAVIQFLYGGYSAALSYVQSFGTQRQWNLVDTVSLGLGRHQFKMGADYRRLAPFAFDGAPGVGVGYFYFSKPSVQTNSADLVDSAIQAPAYPLYTNFSAFAQDEWRVSQDLSLSIGVRLEVNPAPGVTRGLKPYTVQGSGPNTWALAPQGTPLWQTTWYNLAPRVGAAYILRDAPGRETVVRGGVGVFFDTGQQLGSWGFNGPGFLAQGPYQVGSFPIPPAIPTLMNPPVAPYQSIPLAFTPHLQLPYTVQWNASIEQGLGKSQALTISYVGSHGARLLKEVWVSTPDNPNSAFFEFVQNGLTSDYAALQTQFRRRLDQGLTALGSYTWSHCFDYGSGNYFFGAQRGNCDFDVRHNVSTALSYDLPNVGHNRFLRSMLHDWGLDDRFTARTAFPITLQGNFLAGPDGQFYYGSLDLVPGQPVYLYGANCALILQGLDDLNPGQKCPGGRALNPEAFVPVNSGLGTAPRNSARGFGAWQMDFALRRDFPIHERLKLQFRAEAFNIFNHPNFGTINQYLGQKEFGQATATLANSLGVLSPLYQMGGPRSMQFALKLVF